MKRLWVLLPLLALGLAHATTLPEALSGATHYGYRLDACDSHLLRPWLSAMERHGLSSCDTLFSHTLARDTLAHLHAAWAGNPLVSFFVRDLWRVPIESTAYNQLDFVLLLWPARLLLPTGAAFAAAALAPLALATVAGWAFARGRGASTAAALAAALVAGTSGYAMETIQRGQYPQALSVPCAFAFFLGLERIHRGERGGVPLATGGLAGATLLYWQNATLLGVGALVWLGAALLAERPAGGLLARGVAAAALAALACVPAAVPMVTATMAGANRALEVVPWGTPFQIGGGVDPRALEAVVDEVPWMVALSPNRGWVLPVLPLVPAALLGAWRRQALPWLALGAVAFVLALGPVPVVPEGWGGAPIQGYGPLPRVENPVHALVYQWVPTASRMRHPLRWGLLLAVPVAALVAAGVDRLRERWPDHAPLAVGAALAWAVLVGPWPLRSSPFPGAFLAGLDGCSELVLADVPGQAARDALVRLRALVWIPRWPTDRWAWGVGPPEEGPDVSAERMAAVRDRLAGGDAPLPPGACVLNAPAWAATATATGPALERAFGPPTARLDPSAFVPPGTPQGSVEVYRPR